MKKVILAACFITLPLFAIEYVGETRKFIQDNVFICPSTQIEFSIPDLNTGTLQVHYEEMNPGITWQLMFVEELGHMAGITYTKIRLEYPKTDAVLERTAANIKGNVLREGGYLEWCGFLTEKEGKVFQCIIRYPNAGQTVSIRNNWLDTMESVRLDVFEIRQYLIRDGYFLEFKLYFPQFGPMGLFDEEKRIDDWNALLKEFVEGCSLISDKDSYNGQIDRFERPDTYFRFVYKDPSQG